MIRKVQKNKQKTQEIKFIHKPALSESAIVNGLENVFPVKVFL